jgi:hypothetical protein
MTLSAVMAGLVVPAIHAFDPTCEKDVDARDKRGHDESKAAQFGISYFGGSPKPRCGDERLSRHRPSRARCVDLVGQPPILLRQNQQSRVVIGQHLPAGGFLLVGGVCPQLRRQFSLVRMAIRCFLVPIRSFVDGRLGDSRGTISAESGFYAAPAHRPRVIAATCQLE